MKSDVLEAGEFKLTRKEDGTVQACDGKRTILVAPGDDERGHVFHRVCKRMGIKVATGNLPEDQRILVCQLDGVRLYVDGDTYILTKEDVNF